MRADTSRPSRLSLLVLLAAGVWGCNEISVASKPDDVLEVPDTDSETAVPEETDVPPEDSDVPDEPKEDPPVPLADKAVYANTATALYEVDPSTGGTTWVGDFYQASGAPVPGMVDIAINNQGLLYGGSGTNFEDNPTEIWLIDPTTAEAIPVCNPGVVLYAMAFTSSGLLVAGGADTLHSIDLDFDCDIETIVTQPGFQTSGDVVGLPDGLLYWTIEGEGENAGDQLVAVDPTDGTYEVRGSLPYDDLFGLGFDEALGKLYGFSTSGEIVQITPANAASGLVSQNLITAWWGATTNPVVWGN